ncbi:hypothetical protein DERF_010233 [Dermatophagoides farinae]|uniref:Uncharacterized protein n=1 Tax=Dermatophagoides farinae TaxID=6954 RepID=A0A922L3C0_DERFA|nr:hypothetical protein DERF_010233 [Dermatophagoides farinae]
MIFVRFYLCLEENSRSDNKEDFCDSLPVAPPPPPPPPPLPLLVAVLDCCCCCARNTQLLCNVRFQRSQVLHKILLWPIRLPLEMYEQ